MYELCDRCNNEPAQMCLECVEAIVEKRIKVAQNSTLNQQTQPVICEKCGNDMSVDKREGGCVANYCPWCGTRKKQAGA